jgi:hypothetical protein
MPTLFRRDEEVQDFMGNGVSGVSIFVCGQPADVSVVPPSPLISLYADAAGAKLLTAPPQTDAYGRASYFVRPGVYSVVYYSTQIATPTQTLVLTDQAITGPTNLPQFNSDSTVNGTIHPNPDGAAVSFTLSAAPNPPASLVLTLNGLLVPAYAFAGQTVILQTPPPAGSVLSATYQV